MGYDISKLHPRLQDKVAQLKVLCKEQGLELGIGECYRTVAEQNELYAQGRTKPGAIVTNGKGSSYGSQHQWGIAFDFYRNIEGKEYSSTKFFEDVAKLAKGIGLDWGGDWKSFVDRPHLYLPDWGSTTSKLKRQYGTPEKFMATWNEAEVKRAHASVSILDFQKAVLADGFSLPKYGADGYWGEETENAAKKAITMRMIPAVYTNRTKLIQQAMDIAADGYFGKDTAKAVKAYQGANGLSADGVVGIKTWKSLMGIM
jgi:peptidoglycan L-alanyl-D-glutamate endopeptidase CwlK